MTVIEFPSAEVIRAGAHSTEPQKLMPEARFRDGVTDLDMARLLLALERGIPIVMKGYRWTAPAHSPLLAKLASTVSEGIRLGLVHQAAVPTGPHTVVQRAVAAPVHLRSAHDPDRPACPQPRGLKRYRLMNVEDLRYVDCSVCRDLA